MLICCPEGDLRWTERWSAVWCVLRARALAARWLSAGRGGTEGRVLGGRRSRRCCGRTGATRRGWWTCGGRRWCWHQWRTSPPASAHLAACLRAVRADPHVKLVRIKNRLDRLYDAALSAGYRDIPMNIRVRHSRPCARARCCADRA
eukprot:1652474-Rhodomonas_salina.1